MKNYNQMANDVLRRIEEHKTLQRNRRKTMKKVMLPICCFCLVTLLGLGLWKGNFLEGIKPIETEDSTIVGEKDYVESDKNNQPDIAVDVIGIVKYNGVNYVQLQNYTSTKKYTPNEYLGEAINFEGTYQRYLSEVAGGLYNVKEDPNILLVELKNSEYKNYVILCKEENQDDNQG